MKKFLYNILAFSIFALLFYAIGIVVSGKFLPSKLLGNLLVKNSILAEDGSLQRYRFANKLKDIDVMILGSSHAYRGYDPRLFEKAGLSAINLGSSSQSPAVTEFLYKNYVGQLNPKIVIIDVYPVLLGKSNLESKLNLMPIFFNNNGYRKSIAKEPDATLWNSLFYFNLFEDSSKVRSNIKAGENYVEGGYISSGKIVENRKEFNPSKLNISSENLDALKSIVADAKKRKIDVYIFQAPIPTYRYNSYENNGYVDSVLSLVSAYYNFNAKNVLADSMYMDDSHINQGGVEVYNNWVISVLAQKGRQ